MELTAQIKENFKRFGCAVDYGQKCIYVDLGNLDKECLQAATIVARAVYTKWSKNPLLCLAFEISPTRILPRYCYYPFNLANSSETDFLIGIAEAAVMHLVFIGSGANVSREYGLKPWQSRQIKQMCEMGTDAVRHLPAYDFVGSLRDFEATSCIPRMFEHVVSDNDISKIVESAKREAARVPPERRALAQQVCRSFAQVIKARSENLTDEQIRLIYTLRASFMLIVEFYREFGNFDDLAEFVADAIATKTQDDAVLKYALDWSSQLDAGIRWIDQIIPAFEINRDGVRSNFFDTLGRTLGEVARGRELTLPMLQGIFAPLQPFLSSRPGRPGKDYSREFEWKASMSWTDVTRKSLQENPELREEFGGRDFESLDFVQQESLKGRIREGVKNWALRNGKQMPALPDKNPD